MNEAERRAYGEIRALSKTYPEIALQAVTDGHADAMQSLRDRSAASDRALLAALALVKMNRLNAATVEHLNSIVVENINPNTMCDLEREFIDGSKGHDNRGPSSASCRGRI
jgi:hypothetical protein